MSPEEIRVQATYVGVGVLGLLTFAYRFLRNLKSDTNSDKIIERMVGEIKVLHDNNTILYQENKDNSLKIGMLTATNEYQSKAILQLQEEVETLEDEAKEATKKFDKFFDDYRKVLLRQT